MLDSLEQRVLDVLARVAPQATDVTLIPTANFRDQLDFDSVDFLSFAVELGKEVGVEIPESDYPKLSSMAGAVAYLRERGAGA